MCDKNLGSKIDDSCMLEKWGSTTIFQSDWGQK